MAGVFRYRRTELPSEARARRGWLLLCLAGLFCSPWIGFAIHGRVVEEGLETGLKLALIPLAGLVGLTVARGVALSRLPPELKRERREGRIIPPAGAPPVQAPARFSHKQQFIEIQAEAAVLSRTAVLRSRGVTDEQREKWTSHDPDAWVAPWSEIVEWAVDMDMDDADFYRLHFRSGGHMDVCRRAAQGREADLLDAVRGLGGCPVRLLCDVD
jgi:hypothetical protein